MIDRRGLLAVVGALSLGALATACTPSGGQTSPSTGGPPVMNDQTKATLDRILTEQYNATGLAGVAGVVRIGDGIWRGSAGVADLATKIEKYVPGVINGRIATLADLLGMTSGIPDFTADEAFLEEFTADPTMRWSDAETLSVIAEAKRPDFAPGEKVVYCDSNYVLLGMIIAEVTGSPARTRPSTTPPSRRAFSTSSTRPLPRPPGR